MEPLVHLSDTDQHALKDYMAAPLRTQLQEAGLMTQTTSDLHQGDVLTRDCFGRVVTTHACPECRAQFLSAAMCRGVGDGPGKRAHDDEVQTLPIYGCTMPPDQRYAVALNVVVMAPTPTIAHEMAQNVIERSFLKRVVERHGWKLSALPMETMVEANFKRRMDFAHKRAKGHTS